MSFEQNSGAQEASPVVQGEVRELSVAELSAVSGGFIVLIDSVTPETGSQGFLLSE